MLKNLFSTLLISLYLLSNFFNVKCTDDRKLRVKNYDPKILTFKLDELKELQNYLHEDIDLFSEQLSESLQGNLSGIFTIISCLEQELSNNKLEGFEESISQLNKGSNQILDLLLLINEQKLDNCLKNLANSDNGLEKFDIKDDTEFIHKELSQNFRFLGEKLEQSSHKVQNQKGFNDEMPLVLEQGLPSLIIVVVAILIAFSLVVIGVLKFIKKRKQSGINKQQLRMEKLKFLPRVAISSEAIFSESKSGLNGIIPNKSGKTKSGGQNMLSPTYRTTHALKLEENHHSSVINENIFTNIDNSPKSLDDDSPTSSVRNTPKDINFNIEFSMIEQDSKIKSARDNEE